MLKSIHPFNIRYFFQRYESSRLLVLASFLYLAVPFILFAFGWYKLLIGIIVTLILLLSLRNVYLDPGLDENRIRFQDKSQIAAVILIGVWVILSGIGSYFFQNHDFHWRNAIFRDLVQFPWPVTYHYPDSSQAELVYYIGFWLPAAAVGKLLGWAAANVSLLLWTWLGSVLVLKLIAMRLKISLLKISILFILFSGMDALGVMLVWLMDPLNHSTLWPPVQHIEWWSSLFQYSSFTTQLFWVFNQALPAWLCTALIIFGINKKQIGLVFAFCLFYAPLPAIGLAFFVLIEVLLPGFYTNYKAQFTIRKRLDRGFWERYKASILNLFSFDNLLSGILILFLTWMYFKTNQAKNLLSTREITPFIVGYLFVFVVLECGFLWLLVLRGREKYIFCLLTGLLLFIAPVFQLGYYQDLMMRGTIPILFYLMVWSADTLKNTGQNRRISFANGVVLVILAIGSLTPLYEINRSIYRTANYVVCPQKYIDFLCQWNGWQSPTVKADINGRYQAEKDHPGSLAADDLGSLLNAPPADLPNFLAGANPSALAKALFRVP